MEENFKKHDNPDINEDTEDANSGVNIEDNANETAETEIKNINVEETGDAAAESVSGEPEELKDTEAPKHKKILRRGVVIPVCAIIIICLIFAIGGNYIKAMLKYGLSLYDDSAQATTAQVTQNNITMTVNQVENDGKNAILKFIFKKNDGTAFTKNTSIGNFVFDKAGKTFGTNSLNTKNELEDNDKTLVEYVKLNMDNLIGDLVNIKANDLITVQKGTKTVDVDLKGLYNSSSDYHVKLLPDMFPEFTLDKINLDNSQLTFTTNSIQNQNNSNLMNIAEILYLHNTKTGEDIYYNNQGGFDVTDPSMLSDLKIGVMYIKSNVIAKTTWNTNVQFKIPESPLTKNLNITIKIGENKFVITGITVSSMEVEFDGYYEDENGTKIQGGSPSVMDLNKTTIYLKNGSKLYLMMSGNSVDPNNTLDQKYTFNIIKHPFNMDEKSYIDIFLNSDFSYISEQGFVHPTDVKTVEIEGVKIPIN